MRVSGQRIATLPFFAAAPHTRQLRVPLTTPNNTCTPPMSHDACRIRLQGSNPHGVKGAQKPLQSPDFSTASATCRTVRSSKCLPVIIMPIGRLSSVPHGSEADAGRTRPAPRHDAVRHRAAGGWRSTAVLCSPASLCRSDGHASDGGLGANRRPLVWFLAAVDKPLGQISNRPTSRSPAPAQGARRAPPWTSH